MVGDKVEDANWKGLCENDHWQQMKDTIRDAILTCARKPT